MGRSQTVVNLDPIDRRKAQQGVIGKLLVSRWSGGKSVLKTDAFGHYMFCGPQRSGKSASSIWYAEQLGKKYKKRRLKYPVHERCDHERGIIKCKYIRFDEPPKVRLWGNFGVGQKFIREELFDLIDKLDPYANEVRIFLIDEIHTYFPKDVSDKETKKLIKQLNAVFSQLGKRNCYVLSTAQIYGRLDKALREQCLYMVDCKVNYRGRLVNDFIAQEDILVDDLGRWSGIVKTRKIHGLSTLQYDTKMLIRE